MTRKLPVLADHGNVHDRIENSLPPEKQNPAEAGL
jgi:hypothetical protein